MKIRRALLSVSNKEGIVDLAEALAKLGVEILSTGGTASVLREQGVSIIEVSEFTGFPEMMGGRIKTLHPRIHGGILARRGHADDMKQMDQQNLLPIDLVCVNLYPFEQTIRQPDCRLEEAIEQIDIGGPAMLRSASKNYKDVVVLVDPADYPKIIHEIEEEQGVVSEATRMALARKVFSMTANYDRAIAKYLERLSESSQESFPKELNLHYEKLEDLRYGENPHQRGAVYRDPTASDGCISTAEKLHGKAMSFNNYLDANAAIELVREFSGNATVIIKHNNPCGVALGKSPKEAFIRARETDPVSAFGGVVAFNGPVDEETAREISSMFVEIVVATEFHEAALALLQKKKDLRLLRIGPGPVRSSDRVDMKKIVGGMLVQDRDIKSIVDIRSLKVASQRQPTDQEYEALAFAWMVAKHVKSNAIVFARPGQTAGIGAGQMSRVDSVKIATLKAKISLEGSAMASDAFFPFRDGIDEAFKVGATAIIQPGGSIRDEEVIQAVDEHQMTMILTGIRHFKH